MRHTKSHYALLILATLAILLPTPVREWHRARADGPIVLRIATLAPRGSSWMRVFDAWGGSLRQQTNGRLELRFVPGGVSGNEQEFVRKIRAGELDGASITAVGLSQIARSALVLQTPGLFADYPSFDRVRTQLHAEIEHEFESGGYKLLGIGDIGQARIFSAKQITKPADIRTSKPWMWRDDAILTEYFRITRANPSRLEIPQVYPGLQRGAVDTVITSSLAAVALQWYTKTAYVAKQADTLLIGATVIKKEKFDSLPDDLRTALLQTAERAHATLTRAIRRDDEKSYKTILARGVREIDLSPQKSEWDRIARETRHRLAGRLYPRALLDRIERVAAGH